MFGVAVHWLGPYLGILVYNFCLCGKSTLFALHNFRNGQTSAFSCLLSWFRIPMGPLDRKNHHVHSMHKWSGSYLVTAKVKDHTIDGPWARLQLKISCRRAFQYVLKCQICENKTFKLSVEVSRNCFSSFRMYFFLSPIFILMFISVLFSGVWSSVFTGAYIIRAVATEHMAW